MTTIYEVDPNEVVIHKRQRGFFDQKFIDELAESIKALGQLQPGVCRKDANGKPVLINGEQRLRACRQLGIKFKTYFKEDITDPVMLYECELMENLLRRSLTWQEEVEAKARLHELRQRQFGEAKPGTPTGHSLADTAAELHESKGLVSEDIKVALFAREIPEVAKAKSKAEAKKIVKRIENTVKRQELVETIKSSAPTTSTQQQLLLDYDRRIVCADFDEWAETTETKDFDVVLFDPPWGVDFNVVSEASPERVAYEDNKEEFFRRFPDWCKRIYGLMAENAHLYVFFGIVNYPFVYESLKAAGFAVNGIPIIWHKKGMHRTRNPEVWPGRSYEPIAFARKGNKSLERQGMPDIITLPPPNKKLRGIHPSAKNPYVYVDLLRRSAKPGDKVLDPMAGSCMAAVAAETLKTELMLDWYMVEKEKQFRDTGVYTVFMHKTTMLDAEMVDEDDPEVDTSQSDFKHLRPGTKEWMNYWRAHPEKQNEMLAFSKQFDD